MNGKEIKYTLEELEKKLTAKERAFCHEYIIDWNHGQIGNTTMH